MRDEKDGIVTKRRYNIMEAFLLRMGTHQDDKFNFHSIDDTPHFRSLGA